MYGTRNTYEEYVAFFAYTNGWITVRPSQFDVPGSDIYGMRHMYEHAPYGYPAESGSSDEDEESAPPRSSVMPADFDDREGVNRRKRKPKPLPERTTIKQPRKRVTRWTAPKAQAQGKRKTQGN